MRTNGLGDNNETPENEAPTGILFSYIQYIPRNMHAVFALLCFVVVIHWLIFPYPSGLLHWHCGNLTIAPVPAKQPWWIWINTSCEFIMNDCITTTKQSTTKPCAYFLGYTVHTFFIIALNLFLLVLHAITMSRNGNTFRIAVPLWGESTGSPVDSPHKMPVMWSFDILLCWSESTVEQTRRNGLTLIPT